MAIPKLRAVLPVLDGLFMINAKSMNRSLWHNNCPEAVVRRGETLIGNVSAPLEWTIRVRE